MTEHALPNKTGSLFPRDLDPCGNRVWYVSTPPAIEPIAVQEFKTFGRIEGDDEDGLILGLIGAVRKAAEGYLGRALVEQSLTMRMDYWPPSGIVEFPRPPLISVTSVATLDESDVATTYDISNYYTIPAGDYSSARLVIKQGSTPPLNTSRDYGGIQIVWKAGYGAGDTDVPDLIREGLKVWALFLYESRGSPSEDGATSPEEGVSKGSVWFPPRKATLLLDAYRILMV